MKFNLTLIDGTHLNSVILSTSQSDYRIGELKTKEEFDSWLNSEGIIRMYYSGAYVQGGISHPKVVKSFEIFEDDESICTLICNCGKIYNYIPRQCKRCGQFFVD